PEKKQPPRTEALGGSPATHLRPRNLVRARRLSRKTHKNKKARCFTKGIGSSGASRSARNSSASFLAFLSDFWQLGGPPCGSLALRPVVTDGLPFSEA